MRTFPAAAWFAILLANSPMAFAAGFLETFDGSPSSPTPWNPTNWDVTVHSRDTNTWNSLDPMLAAHGPDCAPHPATHSISSYEDTVFQCRDHMMTAINAEGYGVIYFTPNRLIDFSDGEATLRFDVSTLRTSERDWIDIWISPYESHLQLPLDHWLPDLGAEPKNAIHVAMGLGDNRFRANVIRNHVVTPLAGTPEAWRGYDTFLTPSAMRRDTFELRISEGHLSFGMPDHDFEWFDEPFANLGWTKGVVQLGHHSYNPTKCSDGSECGGSPNTWHWDNVEISSAQPFTIIPASARFASPSTASSISFADPAPANAHLRFAGIGGNLEVSYDGGVSWTEAVLQVHSSQYVAEEHFKSYWMPVPAGATQVAFRGNAWFGGDWHVRDLSFWAPGNSPGDYDGSGTVTPEDLALWKAMFRSSVASGTSADGNNNGLVDAADFTVWRDNHIAGNTSVTVPEPSAIVTAVLIVLGLSSRSGRNGSRRWPASVLCERSVSHGSR